MRPLGTVFGQILVEKLNFQFFDLKLIFDHESIFGRKIEIFIFRPKIDLRPLGTNFWQILVEKLNFQFFDQKSIFDLQSQFLVEKMILSFFNQKLI